MNAKTIRSIDSVDQQLDFLLTRAELNVLEFDIHRRNEMSTFNRVVPYYIMSYHKAGRAKLRVGDRHYEIEPGTVICLPPNVEHDHYKDTKEETEFLWWHFTYDIAGVMDALKMFDIPVTFRLRNTERFEEVFHQFVQCTSGTSYLPQSILKQAKALELLYLLLENALSKNEAELSGLSTSNFLGILSRIVRYPEQPVSLNELSQELHMHPTYISNRFKELFGKSPMQVHREMRVQRAKTLLISSEMSVTEIAQAVGFTEIPNFNRLFKSYVGLSPKQFRDLSKKWGDNG